MVSDENTTILIKKSLRNQLVILKMNSNEKSINDVIQILYDNIDKTKFVGTREKIIDELVNDYGWDRAILDTISTKISKENLEKHRSGEIASFKISE